MKFALVAGIRIEATPAMRGKCPGCHAEVIAKCGLKKLWHWAHIAAIACDRWAERETEWHRDWKNEFPVEYQEVRHCAPDGELHIADVKSESGIVLEFQRSAITLRERASRERFYGRMVWVASGTRLKRDLPTFREALRLAPAANTDHLALVLPVDGSAIVERWRGSRCPVYLDFGNEHLGLPGLPNEPILWRLHFRIGDVVATPISRGSFIEHHRGNTPLRGYRRRLIVPYRRVHLSDFERHLLAKKARRARF